jgi:phosphate transport system substrate-binding protein
VRLLHSFTAAGLIAALTNVPLAASEITGAGATFPYPLYAKWGSAYEEESGVRLKYQAVGSGAGIALIKARAVTFGASDAPLQADALVRDGLLQFPMVMVGVVPVLNVEGVQAGQLVLDGATLARIFLGQIKTWDDARIKKLNPGVRLPPEPIVVVHRSDGSGTTFLFTHYLSKVSGEWKGKLGYDISIRWPVGIGTEGNDGVAATVAQTKGAIGYVEYDYSRQHALTFARLLNADARAVLPSQLSFQAAARNADWLATPGFEVLLTDQKGTGSWPITGASFILMHRQPSNPAAAVEALRFFAWAFARGNLMAEELHYVPMPAGVIAAIKRQWASDITDQNGKPILPGL